MRALFLKYYKEMKRFDDVNKTGDFLTMMYQHMPDKTTAPDDDAPALDPNVVLEGYAKTEMNLGSENATLCKLIPGLRVQIEQVPPKDSKAKKSWVLFTGEGCTEKKPAETCKYRKDPFAIRLRLTNWKTSNAHYQVHVY